MDRTDPSRSIVLVPFSTHIHPACERALQGLVARGYRVRRVGGYANIDIARNQLATDALGEGFETLMWIDADVGFDPRDVDRLHRHGLPIVCGIYAKKGQRALACQLLPGTRRITFGRQGRLVEIRYAATGFLLTQREVYEQIEAAWELPVCNRQFQRPLVPYFMPLVHLEEGEPWYLGDDYAFCQRARQCGYRVWADTTIRLYHYGTHAFGWEDAGKASPRYQTFHFQVPGRPAPAART